MVADGGLARNGVSMLKTVVSAWAVGTFSPSPGWPHNGPEGNRSQNCSRRSGIGQAPTVTKTSTMTQATATLIMIAVLLSAQIAIQTTPWVRSRVHRSSSTTVLNGERYTISRVWCRARLERCPNHPYRAAPWRLANWALDMKQHL